MAASAESPLDDLDLSYVKASLDEITQLTDVESLNDPEELPFKSKYAAREVLENLRKMLDTVVENGVGLSDTNPVTLEDVDLIDNETSPDITADSSQSNALKNAPQLSTQCRSPCSNIDRVEVFLMYIDGKLASNYIECEETSSGEEHLNRALKDLVSKFATNHSWTAYVHMYLLNQLGILRAARRESEKASLCLHDAEATYANYRTKQSEAPMFPTDLLAPFKGKFQNEIVLLFLRCRVMLYSYKAVKC